MIDWIFVIVVICLCSWLGMSLRKEWLILKEKEQKYNVSKFPVTSKMGNQYYAEVKYVEDNYIGEMIYCNFYKRNLKSNGKYKDELIERNRIDFESFDYDYIKVVSQCIEKYEKQHESELKKQKHEEEAVKKNKEMFEKWDGIIVEKE
jgi:hypothetical protein